MRTEDSGAAVVERLDGIVKVLQDVFILEATIAGMGREGIRKILGVQTGRISNISKHLKKKGKGKQ